MKMTSSFIKTLRNAPKGEVSLSAQYLLRAGYIYKEMAGVYDYLPLGLRVMNNIQAIVREELNAIGCEEVLMSALQNAEIWEKTGRFDDEVMDIWFKTDLNAGGQLGLAPTHEEPLTSLMHSYIASYKDLPAYVYQFQTKFRNELRAKSGILRTREFLMKDLYSFSRDEAEHQKFYAQVEAAYKRIFDRLGVGDDTFETFASGGAFSKYSHEFQTFLPVGEDTVYFNADKSVCINEEVLNDEVLADLGVKREELQSAPAAEIGNIFTLGYKFSEPLELKFTDKDGQSHPVFMGSYGIGVSRAMGIIAEKFADDKGLIWPETVAPYRYYLIAIGEKANQQAAKLHAAAPELILWDDRDLRPGEKFADAELLGIPHRLVLSDKTLAENAAELTARSTGESQLVKVEALQF